MLQCMLTSMWFVAATTCLKTKQKHTDLVILSELANSLTTQVHEADRLCQYDLMPCYSPARLKCLVLSFVERHAESSGEGVQDLEPNL